MKCLAHVRCCAAARLALLAALLCSLIAASPAQAASRTRWVYQITLTGYYQHASLLGGSILETLPVRAGYLYISTTVQPKGSNPIDVFLFCEDGLTQKGNMAGAIPSGVALFASNTAMYQADSRFVNMSSITHLTYAPAPYDLAKTYMANSKSVAYYQARPIPGIGALTNLNFFAGTGGGRITSFTPTFRMDSALATVDNSPDGFYAILAANQKDISGRLLMNCVNDGSIGGGNDLDSLTGAKVKYVAVFSGKWVRTETW